MMMMPPEACIDHCCRLPPSPKVCRARGSSSVRGHGEMFHHVDDIEICHFPRHSLSHIPSSLITIIPPHAAPIFHFNLLWPLIAPCSHNEKHESSASPRLMPIQQGIKFPVPKAKVPNKETKIEANLMINRDEILI